MNGEQNGHTVYSYIPKYLMAVRNCIHIFVLYGLKIPH